MRGSTKTEFTRVGCAVPTTKLLTIQFVYETKDYNDESSGGYIDRALDELRCLGAAEVTEITIIAETFEEASKILRHKRRP